MQLRCVNVSVFHGSGYMQSDQGEVKAAEFEVEVPEFTEEGMADFNRRVARAEANLQALFDEIQPSQAAGDVSAAQEAIKELRQPLLDRLVLQRMVTKIRLAEDCP